MSTTTKKITVPVEIELIHDPKLPGILSVHLPQGYVENSSGEEIYFSECDGTKFWELFPALKHLLPEDATAKSNARDEAWISHWNDRALIGMAGRYRLHVTTEYDVLDDGDLDWTDTRALLVEDID